MISSPFHNAYTPAASGAKVMSAGVKCHFFVTNQLYAPRHCSATARARRLQKSGDSTKQRSTTMPVKPNGAVCGIREQIVEDHASGLTLLFECENGRARLVIVGKALPFGNREIIFDT